MSFTCGVLRRDVNPGHSGAVSTLNNRLPVVDVKCDAGTVIGATQFKTTRRKERVTDY